MNMKRIVALVLTLALLASLAACAKEEEPKTVTPAETKAETKTEAPETAKETETKPEKVVYDPVDAALTKDMIARIPIANSSMTTDELRQICVDYVCLSNSFQWVPNLSYSYEAHQGAAAPIIEGKLYGGIPYVNVASGNIYRWADIIDPATGVVNLYAFVNAPLLYGTACSGTAGWGWARVINSATCAWTANLNVSHGLLRVGPYTYDDDTDRYGEDGKLDCKPIAQKNGKTVMFESYALVKKGDCMVNNGHVRMAKEDAVVVRKEDGSIDGANSYIIHCEQGLFTYHDSYDRVSEHGITYKIQGQDNLKVTFDEI
ncbi:MAG: hypothetical protein IKQ87_02165, partial [Clostridia bacterium]|nr:hypothetical protein [Clostridia bacterium]